MKKKTNTLLTALLASALLLAGCGDSKSGSTYNTAASQDTTAFESDYGGGWEEKGMVNEAAMDMTSSAENAEPEEASGSSSVIPDPSRNDLTNRKLIKNVSLSLETENFDTMKSNMEESVSSFGGYIEYSSYDAPQTEYLRRSYSLTARIPSEKLDDFVAAAGSLGTLTNKSENVEDVTLDYVDKTAYKESLQVEYERVTELLEKAEDLEQILALESKLSQLRYEINSYESQLRTYDNLINYSTVNIYISEVERETEVSNTVGSRISSGFISSLYSVRDFFINVFVFLIGNLPVLLIWVIVIALTVLLIRHFCRIRQSDGTKKRGRLFSRHSSDENTLNADPSETNPEAPADPSNKE